MVSRAVVVLLDAANATGPWVRFGVGSIYELAIDGVFAAATATVQWKGPGGGTVTSPGPDGVFTAAGAATVDIGAGQEMRVALTNTAGGTAITAQMKQVHA